MLALTFDGPLDILCLGAHCDDIEIGCGGTILQLGRRAAEISVCWVVFSGNTGRQDEARASAADFLSEVPRREIELLGFRESFFPTQWSAIKDEFERLKAKLRPSLIFTHYRGDDHQDHRVIADLTWNTFRDHLILEYEVPKFEDDLGRPNLFVPVERQTARRKVDALCQHFRSQRQRGWFSEDTFMALMRLRGTHANAPSGLAEAFHCRKLVVEGG